MASDCPLKLSKNLLRMKFMQRGLDAEVKKQLEEEEKRIISDEHWYLDLPELKAKESFIIEERSFVPCEDLRFGRMSFKGFNPEVEKLMQLMNAHNRNEEEDEEEDFNRMETDITDEEMANRYVSLVESMKRKFARKRERSAIQKEEEEEEEEEEEVSKEIGPTKRAFLKPQD